MPKYRPDLASHGRQRALEPSYSELASSFHDYKERVNPLTGKKEWRFRAKGKRQMEKLREMMAPSWREGRNRGRNVEALVPKVALNDGSQVAEWTAEEVCKRSGLRERVRRRPTARYLATTDGPVRIA